MAKLFTGNTIETLATQEWVQTLGGSTQPGGTPCGGMQLFLAEADYVHETMEINPIVKVLDAHGQPTGKTITLDHILDLYKTEL